MAQIILGGIGLMGAGAAYWWLKLYRPTPCEPPTVNEADNEVRFVQLIYFSKRIPSFCII